MATAVPLLRRSGSLAAGLRLPQAVRACSGAAASGGCHSKRRPLSCGGSTSTHNGSRCISSTSSRNTANSSGSDSRGESKGSFEVTGTLLDARKAGQAAPQVGQWLQVTHAFPQEAVSAFAQHAGDNNPIHLDEEYARSGGRRQFKGCVVHGLLVSGLFSTLFGRSFPGALYVSQMLNFQKPVHVGDVLTARIEVLHARTVSRGAEVLLTCSTAVENETDGNRAISGEAKVLMPTGGEVR